MYCPQCGQQQISDSTRFCSRCGLLVDGLVQWIARGGIMPLVQNAPLLSPPRKPRRKGVSRGAKLMFISGVLLPIFFGFSVASDTPAPLLVPITIFFAGLSMLLYSVFFGEDAPAQTNHPVQQASFPGMFGNNALPPPSANNQMRNFADQAPRTGELVERPSVTENTTRLLDRD